MTPTQRLTLQRLYGAFRFIRRISERSVLVTRKTSSPDVLFSSSALKRSNASTYTRRKKQCMSRHCLHRDEHSPFDEARNAIWNPEDRFVSIPRYKEQRGAAHFELASHSAGSEKVSGESQEAEASSTNGRAVMKPLRTPTHQTKVAWCGK